MATIQKTDMHIGTVLTEGVFNTRHRRAVRAMFLDGLPGTRLDLATGISTIKSSSHVLHPDTGQPASHITGRYTKDQEAIFMVHYNESAYNPLAGRNNFDLYTDHIQIPWYALDTTGSERDGNGMPNGDAEFPGGLPRRYGLDIPTWKLVIRTVLPYNPVGIIGPAYHRSSATINNAAVTWGGYNIPSQTMRFEAANIRFRGGEYFIEYMFTLRPDPWKSQYIDVNGDKQTAFMGQPVSFTSPGFPEGVS